MRQFFVLLLLVFLILFPTQGTSQPLSVKGEAGGPGGVGGPHISMDLKDANIKDVLKIFSQQAALNFVASEEIQDRTLTLYLDHVTVQDALNNIMSANHLEYVQVPGSDIFVVQPLLEEAGADLIMKVYRLKYARVSDSPLEAAASSATYQAALTSSGVTSAGAGGIAGGAGGYETGPTAGGPLTGGGGVGGGLTGGVGGGQRGINFVLESLLSDRGALVTDPRTNSVIISDIPNRFRLFEEVIAKLDRPVSQVVIEAEILETSVNALDDLGVKWGGSSGTIAGLTGPSRKTRFPFDSLGGTSSSNTLTVGTLTLAKAEHLLELLRSRTDTKILSRPRIMTMDNEGAVINVTAETAVASIATSVTAEGTSVGTSDQAERKTTGISFRVVPQINDDRFVTMTLEPSVVRAEASTFFTSEGFVDPQQRSALTTVMVRDRETVVIGGLVSTDMTDVQRKVPILGDIPILGLLFRHTDKDQLDRELLVFVTPHIVKTSELPFVKTTPVTPSPVTVTVPEETREQLPPYSKEKEIEKILDQFSASL